MVTQISGALIVDKIAKLCHVVEKSTVNENNFLSGSPEPKPSIFYLWLDPLVSNKVQSKLTSFMSNGLPNSLGFLDLPYEIQIKILDRLNQNDHVALHRTSSRFQNMITRYLIDKDIVRGEDWKWFCRHDPKIPYCSRCLHLFRTKNDDKGLAQEWRWWL